ncbi:MAG TPA: YbaK/EbsC family protein [Candidatus Saccharimonadales bacterium]|nr:YbaK/EbsC family protein [Candidatus Saccharimonadales bacterium]
MNALLPLVQKSLDAHHIIYKVFECDPELADTTAFCEKYGFDLDQSANAIIVVSKIDPVQYACCVVLATTKLDVNKKVCQLLGAKKASFAPMEAALQLSGMEYGGVTAFGLPDNIPVYVDAHVMACSEVVMGGGNRSSKVLLDPKELHKIPGMQVVEELAKAKE